MPSHQARFHGLVSKIRTLFIAFLVVGGALALDPSAQADTISSISSNFNGTPIPPGSVIWFSAVQR
jgi:hypothetical protein